MQAKITKKVIEIKKDMYDIEFRVQLNIDAPKDVLNKIYINHRDKEYTAAQLTEGIATDTITDAVALATHALQTVAMVLTKKQKPMNLDIEINIAE